MKFLASCALVVLASGPALAEVAPADVTPDDYGAVEQSLTGAAGSPESGAKIMVTKSEGNCISCHQVSALDDTPFHGEVGPSLDGVADRWGEADLRGILVNAKNVFPGTVMPAYYKTEGYIRPGIGFTKKPAEGALPPLLTATQIEDVVAFLSTLKEE